MEFRFHRESLRPERKKQCEESKKTADYEFHGKGHLLLQQSTIMDDGKQLDKSSRKDQI